MIGLIKSRKASRQRKDRWGWHGEKINRRRNLGSRERRKEWKKEERRGDMPRA